MSSRSLTQPRKGTVKWSKTPRIDLNVARMFFETHLPSAIIIRTQKKSLDRYGKPLGEYSDGYGKRRVRMGESDGRVVLRLTGGLLNSIRARDSVMKKTSVRVTIGAGANRSKVVRPPEDGKFGKWEIDASKVGPRYNQILYWLGPGSRGKKREILGFTKKELKAIAKKITKLKGIMK